MAGPFLDTDSAAALVAEHAAAIAERDQHAHAAEGERVAHAATKAELATEIDRQHVRAFHTKERAAALVARRRAEVERLNATEQSAARDHTTMALALLEGELRAMKLYGE